MSSDPRLNDLVWRDEITDDTPSELPEQTGGAGLPTLLPGTHIFRIPVDVVDCISTVDAVAYDAAGEPIPDPTDPSKAKLVQRVQVKFDKDHPLVIVGGSEDGHPVGTSISNRPRNRARKGEPRILVSDMAYWLRESLKYTGALNKPAEWGAAIQWAAGKIFRAEHGLSAYCNPERVRYINDPADPTFRSSIQDPDGTHGCGGGPAKQRMYTSHFKLPAQNGQPGGYSDITYCPWCSAKLRGFFQVERFLMPTAAMLQDDSVPF